MTTDEVLALMRGPPPEEDSPPRNDSRDSNVIIDVISEDPRWSAWSEAALIDAANRDEIGVNPIIYAEIAAGFATMAALDAHLGAASSRLPLPYEAGFVAGQRSWSIVGEAACAHLRFRISISAPTRSSLGSSCSPATPNATPDFPKLRLISPV